jgi:hypothetical protein
MTEENFVLFMRHFIKNTRCSKDRPVVLLLDNHESHLSVDVLNMAKENGVTANISTVSIHGIKKQISPFDSARRDESNGIKINLCSQSLSYLIY